MKSLKHNESTIYWGPEEGNSFGISLIGGEREACLPPLHLPFTYATMYGETGMQASINSFYRDSSAMKGVSAKETEKGIFATYEGEGLRVSVALEKIEGTSCLCQKVIAEGVGPDAVWLTGLSSATLPCFSFSEEADPRDYELWYCKQSWYGEGQWICETFDEAGITFGSRSVPLTGTASFFSAGTHTTSKYYPVFIIRDKKKDESFFFELEPIGSWYAEIGFRRFWGEPRGCICVGCGCAEERNLHFEHLLRPREKYEAAPCLFGYVKGGIDKVSRELTKMRRTRRRRMGEEPTVFFNDYMNCLWANPNYESCMALAKAAKEVGAEWFIMDSGWFVNEGEIWPSRLGDWSTDSNRFGKGGLRGFLSDIRKLGLRAGVWMEMEVCGEASNVHKMPDNWFVTRKGKRFGSAVRKFFNFTNPEVRSYLEGRIGELVELGVSFLKNDYNDSYFAFGEEETYGMQENVKAFYDFVESLYKKFPELVIENCGSGAMRSDGATLNHFVMQSASDQSDAELYPSIIKGSLLNILPEQLGIWAMPNPVASGEKAVFGDPKYKDGEWTVLNMVNGLAGVLYLSGRIDCCDEFNKNLIREGVELSKHIYPFIRCAHAEYPLGVTRLSDRLHDALILSDDTGQEKLLYVWRLQGGEEIEIPLDGDYDTELLYPKNFSVSCKIDGNVLHLLMPKQNSARLFRLTRRNK